MSSDDLYEIAKEHLIREHGLSEEEATVTAR